MRCKRIVIAMLTLMLAGCVGGAASTPTMLPTATPEPTAIIPTPTSTLRPPPTVTPFPTLPGGSESGEEVTTESVAETPETPTETTAAPTQSPGSPTPTATDTLVPTRAASPTPSVTPTRAAPDGVNLGNRLYQADFYQGWSPIDAGNVHIYLGDGVYIFEVGPRDDGYVNTGSLTITDFYASVEAMPLDCATRSGFGLRFRFADGSNYYALNIWCDDTYTVTTREGGVLRAGLAEGSLPVSLNEETHKIAVAATGSEFAIYFDNELLDTFEDNTHSEGDIAIFAVSQSTGVISVAFDNLEVWSLR